jgi:hypothetical protein
MGSLESLSNKLCIHERKGELKVKEKKEGRNKKSGNETKKRQTNII